LCSRWATSGRGVRDRRSIRIMNGTYTLGPMLVLHVCRMRTGAFVLSGKESKMCSGVALTQCRRNLSSEFRHHIWSSVSDIGHTIQMISPARMTNAINVTTHSLSYPPTWVKSFLRVLAVHDLKEDEIQGATEFLRKGNTVSIHTCRAADSMAALIALYVVAIRKSPVGLIVRYRTLTRRLIHSWVQRSIGRLALPV
jgi:hypothetical protein